MLFKDFFSILALVAILFDGVEPFVQFWFLKFFSIFQLWWTSCSLEQNLLCNFDREHFEEHSCEIILNLDQWFRCHL